jgi:hypothetical protein
MTEISLLFVEFTKIKNVINKILHVQCTTHSSVIQICKFNCRFESEHICSYERMF